MLVDITGIVTYANFGDHWLRGFGVAGGHIFPFSIDFHRRTYNSLALPYERVIPSPLTLSFQPSFLHILPTVAFPFFFRTDSMDSADCLQILLIVSVTYFLVYLYFYF